MAIGFDKSTVTLAPNTAARLSDLLVAEGYTGSMVGAFLEIDAGALTDVYHGGDSSVSSTTGRLLSTFVRTAPPVIDPGGIWLKSATGGDIEVTFEPV